MVQIGRVTPRGRAETRVSVELNDVPMLSIHNQQQTGESGERKGRHCEAHTGLCSTVEWAL